MSIEKRVAVRARRGEIKNAILQVAALAGLLSIAFVAPNVPKVIPRSLLNKVFGRSRSARDVTVSRLLKDGLLAVEMRDGTRMLRITEKGKRYLAKTKLRAANVPRRWDRRWRVVIFDIKEHRRHVRRNLRSELQAYGFYRLQDSVWVFPYACEDFIALLKADLHVGKDILYLVAEEVENERHLRDYFGIGTGGRSA
ncbi:MAG: CRISPR-associated endonuclease Cas2 [Patescibacteria group bacterium]